MRVLNYGVLLVLILTVLGCGGDGRDDDFTGTWTGNVQLITGLLTTPVTQRGTVNLTVAENGDVSGTGVNTTTSETFQIDGTISDNGASNISFIFPDRTVTRSGTLYKTLDHITGTIGTRTADVDSGTFSFDLGRGEGTVPDPH